MARFVLLLVAFVIPGMGCADDDANSEDGSATRCGSLCSEQLCGDGEAREDCIDDCMAQTDGLRPACVQCQIDGGRVQEERDLGDGRYCVFDVAQGWFLCAGGETSCSPVDAATCEAGAPSCELFLGSVSGCVEFCI